MLRSILLVHNQIPLRKKNIEQEFLKWKEKAKEQERINQKQKLKLE